MQFGSVLKQWRQHRRLSQLALSGLSGISQRHISFLENGRAQPSRPTILALADCMDVPLRERNGLLQAAGFSAAYPESLDDEQIGVFKQALEAQLNHHDPYPAIVLDGRWNMVMANTGALRFFAEFVDPMTWLQDIGNPEAFQIARLVLHDNGLAPFIVNWTELVQSFLQRARRDLLANPANQELPILIEEILSHPRASKRWQAPQWRSPPAPAITLAMRKDGLSLSLFTMLAHFGAPQHVSLEEMSLESFFPANAATREWFDAVTAGASNTRH